jgi:hypothetical protein
LETSLDDEFAALPDRFERVLTDMLRDILAKDIALAEELTGQADPLASALVLIKNTSDPSKINALIDKTLQWVRTPEQRKNDCKKVGQIASWLILLLWHRALKESGVSHTPNARSGRTPSTVNTTHAEIPFELTSAWFDERLPRFHFSDDRNRSESLVVKPSSDQGFTGAAGEFELAMNHSLEQLLSKCRTIIRAKQVTSERVVLMGRPSVGTAQMDDVVAELKDLLAHLRGKGTGSFFLLGGEKDPMLNSDEVLNYLARKNIDQTHLRVLEIDHSLDASVQSLIARIGGCITIILGELAFN